MRLTATRLVARPKTLAKLGGFMAERGLVHNGLHHEIYLSDFSDPATMRTILRQPVRAA